MVSCKVGFVFGQIEYHVANEWLFEPINCRYDTIWLCKRLMIYKDDYEEILGAI